MKRSGFKRKPPKPKVRKKRDRLPSIKTMRNKCDALLTPIVKLMFPYCLLTDEPTQVAHHHVHKSKSNALRYYIPNLIPLTHTSHLALHMNESYWASKIVQIRGIAWFEELERIKQTTVKTDIYWYIQNHARLTEFLKKLSTDQ